MDSTFLGYIPELSIGGISFSPVILIVGIIVFLVFLLLLSMAHIRRHFLEGSAKGALFGIFIGFLMTLILEGFLIIGGRTALTEFLGWKDAPKPIANVLDAGRAKLVSVLGISDEIPSSFAETNATADEAITILQTLDPDEVKKVKNLICTP